MSYLTFDDHFDFYLAQDGNSALFLLGSRSSSLWMEYVDKIHGVLFEFSADQQNFIFY